ncbi:phosphotransferase [Paenibacillus sp. M.A.Huq-84]
MTDEERILCALEDIYNLSRPIKCKFLRGSFNDHYSIHSNGKKFILRIYRNKKSYIQDTTDLRFELDFLEFLHKNGLPVASPILSIKNENLNTILYSNELRYIALFHYAEGNQIGNMNIREATIFGNVIANLHKRANHFKSEYTRYKISPTYLIKEPLKSLEKYSQTLDLPEISFFNIRANLLFEHFNQLPLANEAFGLIHGDLNPSNVHYSQEHGFTIFDFDHCAYGWRIHDLAVTKNCFDDNTYKAILEGYQSIRPLSLNEKINIDLYSDVLLLRKSKDILDMLETNESSEEDKRKVVLYTIQTLRVLMDRYLN